MLTSNHFILSCIFLFGFLNLKAQTCCSGGIPISSNLGLPIENKGTIQLALNYDLNELNTLKSGKETLEDQSRRRQTHAAMIQMGYNFTSRFSGDLMLSWIKQDRTINQFNRTNNTSTNGVGDAVILLKYQLYKSKDANTQFVLGLGVKAPTGRPDVKTMDGFSIGADLQPGSGSWDGIFWGQLIQNSIFRPSLSFSTTSTYSLKGSNPNYLGVFDYKFGNELSILLTASDRVNIGNQIFDPAISFRYRIAVEDIQDNNEIPSTGGVWWFVAPSVSYWISPQLGFNFRLELPLLANIVGTQLSPTKRFNIGMVKKFSTKKNINTITPFLNIKE